MMAKRSYDAGRIVESSRKDEAPTNTFDCGLWQLQAMLNEVDRIPFLHKHGVPKPAWELLKAITAFGDGSLAPLLALRGEAPNVTHAVLRWDAHVRAALTYCVQRLHFGSGGFMVIHAARHVAARATAHGLPRTKLTVRGIYYAVTSGSDTAAAEYYANIIAAIPIPSGPSKEERLAWLQQVSLTRLADAG
jgi:hypothetical protein